MAVAFEELGLHRVFAQLDPRNEASAALCRRLGMRLEAHFLEDLWFRGAWGDTAIYAMLAREWPSTS
jgi:aminoglycoside 6'-N-acetyltransferase